MKTTNRRDVNIKCTPAMADALTKIFLAESIQYHLGYGPSCVVVIIDRKNLKHAKSVMNEWKAAVDALCLEIGLA